MRFNPPPNWPAPPPGFTPPPGWQPDPFWPPPPPGWALWIAEPRRRRGGVVAAVAIGVLAVAALTITLVNATISRSSDEVTGVAAGIECAAHSLAERAVCRDIRRNFAAVFAGDVESAKSFICQRDIDDKLNERLFAALEEKGAGARAEEGLKSGKHQLSITDVKINGRTATVTVTQTIQLERGSGGSRSLQLPSTEWHLVREKGTWKLCRGSS